MDPLNGWAVSPGYGGIYSTSNGGEEWVQRIDIQIYDASDVYFVDSTGFIVNFLKLEKSTDSGNNWFTEINSQYILRTFSWLTNSHGFIIGDGIYETINSGNSWNEILELRNIGLRKMQSPLSYIGYSIGYSGLLYKYLDTTYIPVQLVNFTGNAIYDEVILNWTTATETNNYGFEIQKSDDKIHWFKIGFVKGYGTTTERSFYLFKDKIQKAGHYYYRLKQIDYDGSYEISEIIKITVEQPPGFELLQNYPNPFNPSTTIKYIVSEESNVKIKLYDVTGREVMDLVNDKKQPGYYTIKLNLSNLTSGVYFYRMITNTGYHSTKKLIILK